MTLCQWLALHQLWRQGGALPLPLHCMSSREGMGGFGGKRQWITAWHCPLRRHFQCWQQCKSTKHLSRNIISKCIMHRGHYMLGIPVGWASTLRRVAAMAGPEIVRNRRSKGDKKKKVYGTFKKKHLKSKRTKVTKAPLERKVPFNPVSGLPASLQLVFFGFISLWHMWVSTAFWEIQHPKKIPKKDITWYNTIWYNIHHKIV